jgi:hypothetical protein
MFSISFLFKYSLFLSFQRIIFDAPFNRLTQGIRLTSWNNWKEALSCPVLNRCSGGWNPVANPLQPLPVQADRRLSGRISAANSRSSSPVTLVATDPGYKKQECHEVHHDLEGEEKSADSNENQLHSSVNIKNMRKVTKKGSQRKGISGIEVKNISL